MKVKIAKKGYLTWEDTYTNASERKTTGIGTYRGGARDYYSSGTSYKHGKAYKNEYVRQYLVRCGRDGQLSGHVACAFGASDRMALNGVLTARDGKHVYKTKMKHGTFDFGIIKAASEYAASFGFLLSEEEAEKEAEKCKNIAKEIRKIYEKKEK